MGTKVGIGYSNSIDSYGAGVEAAQRAFENSILSTSSFALLFCGCKHNVREVLRGVRTLTLDSILIGGSSVGVITSNNLSYDGFEVGIAIFDTDDLAFRVYKEDLRGNEECEAGKSLALQLLRDSHGDEKALFVFYDSFKSFNPPQLNYATYIFKALEDHYTKLPTTAGAGLFPELSFSTPCYQFFNEEILEKHIVAVTISGNCSMDTTIIHGCKPMSSYKTITKAEGPVIYSIDNKPALELIDELLGPDNELDWEDYALFITLGINKGDKYGLYNETDYASRLTLAVDIDKKALIMFEPDLQTGDDVQLMRRSVDLNYMTISFEGIRKKIKEKKALFAFYIDCLGRAQRFSGSSFEEATEIQKSIGKDIPLLGFYSGVEVARVGANLQALDWTAVLCIITQ